MEKKEKIIKLITSITVAVIFILLIILAFQLIKIGNLKEKSKNLNAYKTELVREINNYNSTNTYYDNNRVEYLESYAREVLGWGEQDETWYTSSN